MGIVKPKNHGILVLQRNFLMLKNAFFGSKSEVRSTIRQNDGGQARPINGGQESEIRRMIARMAVATDTTISNDQSLSCEAEGCQFSK